MIQTDFIINKMKQIFYLLNKYFTSTFVSFQLPFLFFITMLRWKKGRNTSSFDSLYRLFCHSNSTFVLLP